MILLVLLAGFVAYEIVFVQLVYFPSPPNPDTTDKPLPPSNPKAVLLYERLFETVGWEQEPWVRSYDYAEISDPWEIAITGTGAGSELDPDHGGSESPDAERNIP